MIGFFRRLLKDRRGNVLMITAAFMPVIIGAAGLATDTIEWTLWKRQLQRAADSAAIAGVYDREYANGSTTNTQTAVCRDLGINRHTWMALLSSSDPCQGNGLTYPVDNGSMVDQVQVTLKIQQALPFSSFFAPFGFTAPVITASATAASISTGTPCMMALNPTGTPLDNGGNATINAPTCILYSDSGGVDAAAATGSATVTIKAIAAVGDIPSSADWRGPDGTVATAKYLPHSPSLPDPFLGVTPDTTQMHCTGSALDKNTDFTHLGTTNCFSSINLQPHDTVNVPANFGPIYINGGDVDIQGTFNCTGCTVVLTNSSTSTTAPIGYWKANAQGHTNITAPTSGTFSGIAIYQDRRATGTHTDTVNGGSNNLITGAVYFPNDTLKINGTGEANSLCAMWVAKNITFLGGSDIKVSSPDDSSCSGDGLTGPSAVKMVRLVA